MFLYTAQINSYYDGSFGGGRVCFGPYLFEDGQARRRWEEEFVRALKRLNTELFEGLYVPDCFRAVFTSAGEVEDATEPPPPHIAVANLKELWNRQAISVPVPLSGKG